MRSRVASLAMIVVLAYGCATTSQPHEPGPSETLQGVASWYGEEFAGRTTANGEIFDPTLLTAAHRSLPFGTILDVTNTKTAQTVRVRVNDRGPYIGGRIIDLSYAAAKQIGLIEPGIGDVVFKIVKVGSGEREPPAPFDVTIAEAPKTAPVVSAGDAPPVDFPLPGTEAVVDRVDVQTQRGDVITRKQVGPDGRTLEDVPIANGEATSASSLDEQRRPAPAKSSAQPRRASTLKQYMVQVGAFSVEANAKSLQERLTSIGHHAFIDREDLYRVRIGPFTTREQAVAARASLEANGLSAMIVAE
ncbi:MAG: septal ring lytic transglycosylase RlpA family protein [Thermoanaerobaculia bacterium]